jgi:hypothetical protein
VTAATFIAANSKTVFWPLSVGWSVMSPTMTAAAPWRPAAIAVARPRPLEAPVTITTLELRMSLTDGYRQNALAETVAARDIAIRASHFLQRILPRDRNRKFARSNEFRESTPHSGS